MWGTGGEPNRKAIPLESCTLVPNVPEAYHIFCLRYTPAAETLIKKDRTPQDPENDGLLGNISRPPTSAWNAKPARSQNYSQETRVVRQQYQGFFLNLNQAVYRIFQPLSSPSRTHIRSTILHLRVFASSPFQRPLHHHSSS